MVTNEVFEKLKDLQEILKEKYDLQKKVQDSPKQLSGKEELLARFKKEYISKSAEYEEIKDKVGKLKVELEEAVKSREDGEKGMDTITSHREYEALEKQISEAQSREEEIRKELQKEEKKLEETKEDLNVLEEDEKDAEADVNASRESLNSQLSEYKDRLTELEKAEAESSEGLDQEILFKFQRIIQRNSEGIVAVRGGVCTGCHMILPAQFANTIRAGEDIDFCPYCSRILFYDESEAGETDYSSIAGNLVGLDDDDEDENEDEDLDSEEREDRDYDDGDNENDRLDDEDMSDDEDDSDDMDESEDDEE